MHAKNQDRSLRKISRERQFFSAGFISVSHDFTLYFHFRCVPRATFDRNLIHSADPCFLVMACVGYSRMQLKTLSSLLKLTKLEYGKQEKTCSTVENFEPRTRNPDPSTLCRKLRGDLQNVCSSAVVLM